MMAEKIANRLPEIDPKPIDEIVEGHQKADFLFTAMDYGICELLSEPKTADQISESVGTDPSLTEKFLNVLVALNFINKIEHRYSNTKLAETFLVKNSPFYRGTLLEMEKGRLKDWQIIRNALKSGAKKGTDIKGIIDRAFVVGHAEACISGALQRTVEVISTLSEIKKAKKLLDLGGGHGLYSIAFVQNFDLEVVLFDFPWVTEIAKEYFDRYGVQNKIKVIAGDFTKDDIGSDYDIIFASDVDITISGTLHKVYDALNGGGILIYRRWVMGDDKTSPLTSVLFDFMLAMGGCEHSIYTLGEYIRFLKKAGFSVTRILDISYPRDPTKIIIAKKEV